MFLLHFLPDGFLQFIINIVLLTGAGLTGIGFFLVGFIPGLRNYKTLIQIVGVVLLALGIYWKGGYGVEMEWRAKVAELQAKVAAAEAKSKETNTVIQEKIVTKVKHVKDVQVKISQFDHCKLRRLWSIGYSHTECIWCKCYRRCYSNCSSIGQLRDFVDNWSFILCSKLNRIDSIGWCSIFYSYLCTLKITVGTWFLLRRNIDYQLTRCYRCYGYLQRYSIVIGTDISLCNYCFGLCSR